MKSNNSILLIDEAFDPAIAPACDLLVRVGIDSFSYAVINTESNKVEVIYDEQECENVSQNMAELLQSDSNLGLPYQDIKISYYTENTISVPNGLFDETQLAFHTQFFTAAQSENLYLQPQSFFGFTTIFSLPPNVDNLFNSVAKKFQQGAGLLKLAENTDQPTLLLDFTVGTVNILFLSDRQVMLQQCYEIENADEFNYYLILLIKQLGINTKETLVNLSGIIHQGDERYNCMLKYFRSIEFLSTPSGLDQKILTDMPTHYYTSLLALYECEL